MTKREYDFNFRILCIGDENVGKTSIINNFVNDFNSSSFEKTLGVDIKTKIIEENNKNVKLIIFDTSGIPNFSSIINFYFKYCNGILLFFDINSKKSFYNSIDWITKIEKSNDFNGPIILIGTKINNDKRKIMYEEIKEITDKFDIEYIETLINEDKNIDFIFHKITRLIQISKYKIKKEKKEKKIKNRDCCLINCNIL